MKLTNKSYNREDIYRIIVDNELSCECCYKKKWFDLDNYIIEYNADAVGPQLILECKFCYNKTSFHIFNLKRPIPRETEENDNMCYTGKCKYENYMGECNLNAKLGEYPLDADCCQQDLYIAREEIFDEYNKMLNGEKKVTNDFLEFNTKNIEDEEDDPFGF